MLTGGYQPLSILYQGNRTIVYRALRLADQTPVVIKTSPKHLTLAFSDHLSFRNQFTIGHNLQHPGIVRTLSLECIGSTYALIMEDEPGVSLSNFLQCPITLLDGLQIAVQLAEILHYLCQQRVLHKDIKPANILINPDSKQVKLLDFSIASLLPKETQEIKNPNVLAGTLPYMAPEQTGRMNRGIDFRSDFYSLGVTLFELFSGHLPFQAKDPMAWVHCHIAQPPPSLTKFGLPKPVAEIVSKLMAKNAEDRYQSALGLKHDVELCLTQLQMGEQIKAFELGQRDVCDRFLIPEKLYGRKAEVKALLDAFDRVTQGSSEMMLVAGSSGIGKTAIVNEIHKPITRQKGYFIKGKFDQFNRNIPFSAFVQAFRSLMGQLLGESEANLAHWQAKILDAIGESGQALIEVIPELESIIGSQPAVTELSGTAAQNRFNLLIGKFIQVFATPEHPLVVFLDDLQWVDLASLNLLKLLMDASQTGALLILGAYRHNEVFPAHPLMLTLNEIRQQDSTVKTLMLEPLKVANVHQLVADSLRCLPELTLPFSELVYQKTQGNPFFTTQFLTELQRDGYINFDLKAGYWLCNLTQVRQLAVTNDVVALMVKRLQKLPEATQNMLKIAACIDNQFDLDTLAMVSRSSQDQVAKDLWQALQSELIIPESETYKFFQIENHDVEAPDNIDIGYRFLHDRVQQAAYALIPDTQKQRRHWEIGQLLLQAQPQQKQGQNLFEIVNQLNRGQAIISLLEEKIQLAALNLQAGTQAKRSAAYQTAYRYYEIGIHLLSPATWQTHYDLMYSLHYEGSEAAYLCGNFDQAEALCATTLSQASTALDQAAIYRVKMTQYQLQGRNTEAIAVQHQSLQLLGLTLPDTPDLIQAALDTEIATVERFLSQQSVDAILQLPQMDDLNSIETLRILQILFYAAWLDGQPILAFLALAKMTTLSLRYGNSEMSPFGYVGYGMLANALRNQAKIAHQFGQMAVQLCELFNNADVRGMTNFLFAADVHSWSRPLREATPYYEAAYSFGMQAGNWLTVSFVIMQSGSDYLTAGLNLEHLSEITQTQADFLYQIKSFANRDVFVAGVVQPIRHLLGLTDSLLSFDDETFSEADYRQKYHASPYHLVWLYSVKIRHAYLFQQQDTYAEWIPKLSLIEQTVASHAKVPSSVFYVALMHLALIEQEDAEIAESQHWQSIQELECKLERWSQDCPENIHHKCLLIQAEKARLNRQRAIAMECYDEAIAQAKDQEYLYEEALGNELAAKFYLDWGREKVAAVYLQEAYGCYARWGAIAKTDDLEQRYPQLLQPILQQTTPSLNLLNTLASLTASHLSIHSPGSVSSSHTSINTALDLATVFKSAQALTESLQHDELLEKLTQMMLQNSGADSLVFLLPEIDGSWHVRATATPETTQLSAVPLSGHSNLPMQLIHYVKNTKEILVFDDLDTVLPIIDDYLQQHQPRSVLCLPILHQGDLSGLLYLQNQSTSGVFTQDRITVLNFLCTQAAISLKNAQLYENLALRSRIIDSSVDSMAILEEGKYVYLNQSHVSLFGYEPEELMGESWEILYSPDEVQRLGETAFAKLVQDQCWLGEATATRKDGSTFVEEVSLFLLDDGKLICICRDISDRQHAIAALELSEARSRAAFEQAAVGFAETDMQTGKLIRVNTLFCEMTGYTRSELAEMTIAAVTHPEDVADSKQAIQQLYTRQVESFTLEKRYIRKDGTYFWSETTVYLVKLQGGQAVYSLGIIQDISDRKATEKALSLTRFAVENSATSFFWLNETGQFLDANETACKTLGYTLDELQSKYVWDIDPNFQADAWSEYWQSLQKKSYQQFESYHRAKNHRLFPVEINSSYLEYDGQGFIFAQAQDISNRKQAEKSLLFTQYSVDNAADCIFWIKPDGGFAYANHAASKMHGYSIEELMLMSVFDINPSISPEFWEPHWQAVREQNSFSLESEHQTKDGQLLPVEVVVNFLGFEGEEYNFVRVRDISDRKAAEAELHQLNTKLEQRVQTRTQELSNVIDTLQAAQKSLVEAEKMAALGNLVAGVAHEINTPIGTSITVASTLADETNIFLQAMTSGQLKRSVLTRYTDVAQKCSNLISSNLGRAGDLVQSFKQVAVDQTHQERRTFNLMTYLQEVVTSLHPQVKRSGHQLSLTGDNSISLTNNPGIFAQVVTNLVANSIKHAYQSGESGQLQLHLTQQDNQVILQYSDNGCGISPEHLDKVYEPFFTTARHQGGTGLGLNIVYNIVTQSLQGTIEIQSQKGEGTTFIIILPL